MPESTAPDHDWIEVCAIDQLSRGSARTLCLPHLNVVVFRLHDDRLCAVEDRCPHRGARLSAGLLYEIDKVACLDHGWAINLVDGRVEAPNQGSVVTFPAKVESGRVFVRIAKAAPGDQS